MNEQTRRAALGAILAAPAVAALSTSTALAVIPAEPIPAEEGNSYSLGFEDGEECALWRMAAAWVNRWTALGGSFGVSYKADGSEDGLHMGIPMSYVWTPPTREEAEAHSPTLRPHEIIWRREDFDGAQKMLTSLLTLVPGLRDAVVAYAELSGRIRRLSVAERAMLKSRKA
jgi:hypothetical protein